MKIDLARVREIVDLFADSEVTELTVRSPEFSVTVRKNVSVPVPPIATRTSTQHEVAGPMHAESEESEIGKLAAAKSTAVGFVHLDRKDDAGPFVEVGSTVSEGQVVCLVESMNVTHEVHAPCEGKIESIVVHEGEPVEYGKALMWIEPAPVESS